jgi:hypothetical protein
MEDELAIPRSSTLAERNADWFLLIRRLCGVPDVVSDEIALKAVCAHFLLMVDTELRDEYAATDSTQDAAHAIVGRVVNKGNAGELDWFLMDTPGPHGVDGLEAAANLCIEGWTPPSEFRLKFAVELLGHLGEYVADHRFQADCGCYID